MKNRREIALQEKAGYRQREYICKVFREHEGDKEKACTSYAQAERSGLVRHKSNVGRLKPEQYAIALWSDGIRKGWLR